MWQQVARQSSASPKYHPHFMACPTGGAPRAQTGRPTTSKGGGAGPLTGTERMPDFGKHAPPEQTLHRRHASKHVAAHATSHPRVHDIQTPGKKAVPYNGARPRTPPDVTLESQRPTDVAPAPIVARRVHRNHGNPFQGYSSVYHAGVHSKVLECLAAPHQTCPQMVVGAQKGLV